MKKKNLVSLIACSTLALSIGVVFLGDNKFNATYSKDLSWWENNCVMPDGYTSIADIISDGTDGSTYTTRGTITAIEGTSFFIQSQGKGLFVNNPSVEDTLAVGNVVDVTGKFGTSYSMVRLTNSSASLYAETNPTPVIPFQTTSSTVRDDLPTDGGSTYVEITGLKYSNSQNASGDTINFSGTGSINAAAVSGMGDYFRTAIPAAIAEHPDDILCFRGVVAQRNTALQMRISSMDNFYFIEEEVPDVLVTSISVSPKTKGMYVGGSIQLSATVLPDDATNKTVTWSTTSGATIDSTGLFTSDTVGTYIVTATANDGSGVSNTATIIVSEESGLDYGYVVDNPTQNGTILGPMYVPGSLDIPSISFLEMVDEYGDSILFDYGDFEMLIDAGQPNDMRNVMAAVNAACDDGILEVVIVTHPHEDHYGGILKYSDFSTYGGIDSIKYWVDFGCDGKTDQYRDKYVPTRQEFLDAGTIYYSAYEMFDGVTGYPNEFMITNDITLKFLDGGAYIPVGTEISNSEYVNEVSVCSLLSIGNTRYFLCGDSTNASYTGIEYTLMNTYGNTGLWSDSTYNVVKANHHCSDTHHSNSDVWVNGTLPDCVILSASIVSTNRKSPGVVKAQHPRINSVDRYKTATTNLYCNMINGTITFTHTDFVNNPTMSFAGRSLDYYEDGVIVSREAERTIHYQDSSFYSQCLPLDK